MTTGIRKRRRTNQNPIQILRVQLHEDIARFTKPLTVDREAGIIKGVKMLGWVSENKRRYDPEAAKRAVARGLYENAKAFFDHPGKPDDPRITDDSFGRYVNVRWTPEGVFGDLVYLKSHPKAERVCEDAERGLAVFGCSHNAEGDGTRGQDGIFDVTEIVTVRSVDIVAESATTTSLSESRKRQPMKKLTIRKFLESVALPKLVKAKAPGAKTLKKLVEEDKTEILDEEDAGMEIPEEEPEPPAGGSDWRASLAAVAGQLMTDEDPEAHEIAKKLAAILKPTATVAEEEEEEEEVPVEESGSNEIRGKNQDAQKRAMWAKDPDGVEGKRRKVNPAMAQLQEQLAAQGQQIAKLTEEKALAELQAWVGDESRKRNLKLSGVMLETVLALKDRKKIGAHLDELKALAGAGQRQLPRSQFSGAGNSNGHGLTEGTLPKNGKDFAERLRSASR